jgi:predicted TIM-barrel fold metal-dependent hydrolase
MLTRRRFIGSTIGAGAALATGAQPAFPQPATKRTIVDAQVHLWKANSPDLPWVEGGKPQIPEPFTIERALQQMDEVGIDRAVVVPPSITGDRNDYALEAARRHPDRFAVMGRIPMPDPKSAALLPKWKEQPGMLGIRATLNTSKTVAWVTDGSLDWLWSGAEKAGVPIMLSIFGHIPAFAPIAERYPGLQLIIDHMGTNPEIAKQGKVPEAIGQTVALAKYPNVSVKVSNLQSSSLEPYPHRDLTEHIRRVFDAYGPQRCYWGSDVTSGYARVNWRQRLAHVTETLDFMSEQDKDWVLGRALLQRLKWA